MRTTLLLVPIALAGCSAFGDDPVACTMEYRYGLTVEVRDAATGAPLTEGVTVVARERAYRDTLRAWPGDGAFVGVGERAGTYTVTAAREGYAPWSRNGVRITADQCHVHPVRLTASLQPL